MPFAIIRNGAAYEVFPGTAFTTVTPEDGEIRHASNALILYGPEDLARYGIQTPAEPTVPEGKEIKNRALRVTAAGVIEIKHAY